MLHDELRVFVSRISPPLWISLRNSIKKRSKDASLGTLSNRRRRPDDGNRKRDISFETTLRMYQTLWPDVALK